MEITALALDGLNGAQSRVERVGRRIAAGFSVDAPADRVDLSAEMAELLGARREFAASLRVLETADEMTRHMIDVFA